ncbi:MAG: phosphoesterase [Alphaproteobacteria bacterium]|nr:phosphoesterase [Alphaproteobacteria bacterium]MDE2630746.1 phosphoesterase [Alphaproteobacteria bacterium]
METIRRFSSRLLFALLFGGLACTAMTQEAGATPRIGHVFVIVLENQSYSLTFGKHSPAPYLSRTLRKRGAFLSHYYGIGHASLDNYIAMVSGQPPNEDTQRDCPVFDDFQMRAPGLDPKGRALGRGCVYPALVKTLPDQLEAAGRSWRAYMEDMGKDPDREGAACAHSAVGAKENLLHATPGDQYAVRHDPFVYFHSIIDDPARCNSHVVPLDALENDLKTPATTADFNFITPNLCDDGHDAPCIDRRLGGLVSADAFLRKWVPLIRRSPAFKRDGLLIVTFDEAGAIGREDSAACCGEEAMPGASGPPGGNGPGGGRVGAVLLSPSIRPGTVSRHSYNHYSLLRSIEDIFGIGHLALAGGPRVKSFGADVFGR